MRTTRIRIGYLALVFALPLLAQAQAGEPAYLIGLGDLPDGRGGSFGCAISPDGAAVAGVSDSPSGLRAFVWTAAQGMLPLRRPDGGLLARSLAHALGPAGAFVVGVAGPGAVAFRWSAATGARSLGVLPGPVQVSQAYGISDDGDAVVGLSQGQAFRWTPPGGMVGLGVCPEARTSEARAISADGAIVAGFCEGRDGFRAARWSASEGMVSLGQLAPEFPESLGLAISPDGSVIVGGAWSDEADGGSRAFRWTRELGMLEIPGCFRALDVSARGDVVVGSCETGDVWDAARGARFLWALLEEAGVDLSGWSELGASAVSDDGHVFAGSGKRVGDSRWEAILAVLPADSDGDGVPDAEDRCPGTAAGDVVEPDSGCSIAQRCACDAQWRGHGAYLACVSRTSLQLVRIEVLGRSERRALLRSAARSRCGRPA